MTEYYELHCTIFSGIPIFYTKIPNENVNTIDFGQWLNDVKNENNEDKFFKYIVHNDNDKTNYIDKYTLLVYDELKENIVGIFNKKTNLITQN